MTRAAAADGAHIGLSERCQSCRPGVETIADDLVHTEIAGVHAFTARANYRTMRVCGLLSVPVDHARALVRYKRSHLTERPVRLQRVRANAAGRIISNDRHLT